MFGVAAPQLFVATLFVALVAVAAYADATSFRIPNRVTAAIAALYPAWALASPAPVDWVGALAVAGGLFAVGFGLFAAGAVGGGDVKLLAAVALWAGPAAVLEFVFAAAIAGGLLALVLATGARFRVARVCEMCGAAPLRDAVLGNAIPYGVAIAAGALICIAPALFGA